MRLHLGNAALFLHESVLHNLVLQLYDSIHKVRTVGEVFITPQLLRRLFAQFVCETAAAPAPADWSPNLKQLWRSFLLPFFWHCLVKNYSLQRVFAWKTPTSPYLDWRKSSQATLDGSLHRWISQMAQFKFGKRKKKYIFLDISHFYIPTFSASCSDHWLCHRSLHSKDLLLSSTCSRILLW